MTRKDVLLLLGVLVVLTIGVIPFTRTPNLEARELVQAREIYLAVRRYADDTNGRFPGWGTDEPPFGDANQAYSTLLPEYIDSKLPFYVAGSPWSTRPPAPEDAVPPLKPGENHWAYVPNLTLTSERAFPIIADGSVKGTPGVYPLSTKAKPTVVTVIRIDGTGTRMTLPAGESRVLIQTENGQQVDLFQPGPGWLKKFQAPLNPAAPPDA